MKIKLFKRIGSFALVFAMMFVFSATAFAAEPAEQNILDESICIPAHSELTIDADPTATGQAAAWSVGYAYPVLSSYLGLTKTIRVVTQSSGTGGAVDLELYKDGVLKSDGNWMMGTNDTGEWKLTLPSSGTYTLKIINQSDATVYVTAQWL